MTRKTRFPFGRAKPVIVEWEDSAATGRWGSREEYRDRGDKNTGPIRSVGWVNHRSARVIQLVQTQSAATGDVCDAITIPRACVKRIRRCR